MGDLPRSKNRFCVGWASEADRYLFLLETPLEKIQKRLVFFGARGFDKGVVARPSLYPHAEHIKNLFIFFKIILSNRRNSSATSLGTMCFAHHSGPSTLLRELGAVRRCG